MIYDCFLYSGESTMLEIRYNELAAKWDDVHMMAFEGTHTFTGNSKIIKPLHNDRIEHAVFYHIPYKDPWENEKAQRNYILEYLHGNVGIEDDDIVILSDVDEIPRRHVVLQYRREFGICSLVMDQMYFYFNALASRQTWRHPKIMTYADLRNQGPETIRNAGTSLGLLDAGFHFSYVGDIASMLIKLESFSHQEPEVQMIASAAVLEDKQKQLCSPWGDKLTLIDVTELPLYIQENKDTLYVFER